MHGNVLQWVPGCFEEDYPELPSDGSAYEKVFQLKTPGPFPKVYDMAGTSSCSCRMVRGGYWGDPPSVIRSAFSFGPGPGATLQNYRSGGVGFRVARTLD
jgi:formylglycine-generating enzyme required for sulfatase activity